MEHPHPTAALLDLLKRLTYDELIDFADYEELRLARRGVTANDEAAAARARAKQYTIRQSRKGKQWSPNQGDFGRAIDLAQHTPTAYHEIVISFARETARALAPVEKRRKRRANGIVEDVAKGRIEIKYIKLPVYDLMTGARLKDDQGRNLSRGAGKTIGYAPEIPGYGPYLYVRIWATGGGRDRTEKKLRSKYVGLKGLAMYLEATFENVPPESPGRKLLAEEIIDRYIDGTLPEWAKLRYPDLEDELGPDDSEDEPDEESDPQRSMNLWQDIGEGFGNAHRVSVHGPLQHYEKKQDMGTRYRCVHKHSTVAGGWKEIDKQFLETADDAQRWFDETINSVEDGQ